MLPRSVTLVLLTLLSSVDLVTSNGYEIAVEYSSSNVLYFGDWEVNGKPPNDTTLTIDESASATLAFTGTAISVYGLIDSSTLNVGYNFTLDSQFIAQFTTADNATPPYNSTPCSPAVLFNLTDLPYGPHILQVTNAIPSFLGFLALKRFIYFDPEAPGPVPPASCTSSSSPGLGGLIAGVVVGSIAGIALLILIVFGWRKQRRERGLAILPPKYSRRPTEGDVAGTETGAGSLSLNRYSTTRRPDLREPLPPDAEATMASDLPPAYTPQEVRKVWRIIV